MKYKDTINFTCFFTFIFNCYYYYFFFTCFFTLKNVVTSKSKNHNGAHICGWRCLSTRLRYCRRTAMGRRPQNDIIAGALPRVLPTTLLSSRVPGLLQPRVGVRFLRKD